MAFSVATLLASCSDTPSGVRPLAPSAQPSSSSSSPPPPAADTTSTSTSPASVPSSVPRTSTSGAKKPTSTTATATPAAPPEVVEVAYRLERRTTDPDTAGFEAVVEATLTDARGWSRAGFRLVRRDDAPFVVVLAEGAEVDQLCLPRDTYGLYSCQRGPVVALNADRWRRATPKWTADVPTYRQMLVNHEVGHLLGQHHPARQCPAPGRLAPIMAQQSTELNGCLPNPWPLEHEVTAAARHVEPLAPP